MPAYPLYFAKGPNGESLDARFNGSRHTTVFTEFHALCKLVGLAGSLEGYHVITISSDTVMRAFLYDAEGRGVKQIVVDPQNEPGEFVWIERIAASLASRPS
jgi:hypothetical protein